jgi:hypothetical protein
MRVSGDDVRRLAKIRLEGEVVKEQGALPAVLEITGVRSYT